MGPLISRYSPSLRKWKVGKQNITSLDRWACPLGLPEGRLADAAFTFHIRLDALVSSETGLETNEGQTYCHQPCRCLATRYGPLAIRHLLQQQSAITTVREARACGPIPRSLPEGDQPLLEVILTALTRDFAA